MELKGNGIMADHPRMKPIELNEPVPITLPAHIWVGFLSAYMSTEWGNSNAGYICEAIEELLMDPVWLKEQQAAFQQHKDRRDAALERLTGGRPDFPPGMSMMDWPPHDDS